MRYEVGQFTLDTDSGTFSGPAEYLEARGGADAVIDKALNSAVFNYGVATGASPNQYIALLVAIQTDYAGWKGTRDSLRLLERAR